MFKVTGISTLNGVTKVRYANDYVSRFKILNKGGHTDINLIELPEAMSKIDCVRHLKSTPLYENFKAVIDAAEEKYSADRSTVKVSMDSLVARAEAVTSPTGWETVNTGTEETAE